MESNVISLRPRKTRPKVEAPVRDIQFARVQAGAEPQPQAPSDKLVRLTKALIVRLRDGRFNQRARVYRELDTIARSIEREAGVAPGSWV